MVDSIARGETRFKPADEDSEVPKILFLTSQQFKDRKKNGGKKCATAASEIAESFSLHSGFSGCRIVAVAQSVIR